MAQSDITIDALSKVGQQDAEYLVLSLIHI